MLIYTLGGTLVNGDNIKWITFGEEDGMIIAYMMDNTSIVLGDYRNGYETEQVMLKLAQSFGAISCYKMPERND